MENDFALIELSEPFNFDRTVQPACLPQSDVLPGQITWTSGWGRLTSGIEYSEAISDAVKLQKTHLSVFRYEIYFIDLVDSHQLPAKLSLL